MSTQNEIGLGELIKVLWNDAHGSAANVVYDIDEIPHGPIECTSYGLLLKQDELGVSIASEQVGVDTYRGYSFVPVGMRVKLEPVKKPKRPRKPKPPATPIPGAEVEILPLPTT